MGERRTCHRRNMLVKVEVRWQDNSGALLREDGRVEDESAGGVCIRISKPLAAGWKLVIQSGGTIRPGIVQRCERNRGAFLLGVKWEGR
jgi:hypothetical protein